MAELSPEVKKLLAGAEALYEAFKRSQPTRGLAEAIRDNTPFQKLQDAEILVLVRFSKELDKLAAAAIAAATNGTNGQAPAAGEPVKPDGIEPPKGKQADKKKSESAA